MLPSTSATGVEDDADMQQQLEQVARQVWDEDDEDDDEVLPSTRRRLVSGAARTTTRTMQQTQSPLHYDAVGGMDGGLPRGNDSLTAMSGFNPSQLKDTTSPLFGAPGAGAMRPSAKPFIPAGYEMDDLDDEDGPSARPLPPSHRRAAGGGGSGSTGFVVSSSNPSSDRSGSQPGGGGWKAGGAYPTTCSGSSSKNTNSQFYTPPPSMHHYQDYNDYGTGPGTRTPVGYSNAGQGYGSGGGGGGFTVQSSDSHQFRTAPPLSTMMRQQQMHSPGPTSFRPTTTATASTNVSTQSADLPGSIDTSKPAVFVQNLDPRTTERQLFDIFFPMGASSVSLHSTATAARKTGVVYFTSAVLAEGAAQKINNFVPHGQTLPLTVSYITNSGGDDKTNRSTSSSTNSPVPEGAPAPHTPRHQSSSYGGGGPSSQFDSPASFRGGGTMDSSTGFAFSPSVLDNTTSSIGSDTDLPAGYTERRLPPNRHNLSVGSTSTSASVNTTTPPPNATASLAAQLQQLLNQNATSSSQDSEKPIHPRMIEAILSMYQQCRPEKVSELTAVMLQDLSRNQHRGIALLTELITTLANPPPYLSAFDRLKNKVQDGITRPIVKSLLSSESKSERIGCAIVTASLFDAGFIGGSPFSMAKKLMKGHGASDPDLVDALVSMTSAWSCHHMDRVDDDVEEAEFRQMVSQFYESSSNLRSTSSGAGGDATQQNDHSSADRKTPAAGLATPDSTPLRETFSSTHTTPEKPGNSYSAHNTSISSVSSSSTNPPSRAHHGQSTSSGFHSTQDDEETLRRTVYVTRLPIGTPEARLRAVFTEYGEINKVRLYEDNTGRGGFGFIEFTTVEAAKTMIQQCDKRRIDEAVVRCNTARSSIHDMDPRDAVIEEGSGRRLRGCLFGLSPKPKNQIRRFA